MDVLRRFIHELACVRHAQVLSVSARGRTVYCVHTNDTVYLLDDYGELFSTVVVKHWINTRTGDTVGSWRSFVLSATLERALALGTVQDLSV